jgi:hypothetical protein
MVAEINVDAAGGGGGGATMNDVTDKVEFQHYEFKVNGTTLMKKDFADLPVFKTTVTTENMSGEKVEATYTGLRLKDVLAAAGVTDYTTVTAVANDGYTTDYDKAVADADTTLVAIEKDKATGEDGTVWLAPCGSTTAKDYSKLVVEITTK